MNPDRLWRAEDPESIETLARELIRRGDARGLHRLQLRALTLGAEAIEIMDSVQSRRRGVCAGNGMKSIWYSHYCQMEKIAAFAASWHVCRR